MSANTRTSTAAAIVVTAESPFATLRDTFKSRANGVSFAFDAVEGVRAYNLVTRKVRVNATITLPTADGMETLTTRVRDFTIAVDLESGAYYVPSKHRKTNAPRTKKLWNALDAVVEIVRAQRDGESLQLTAKQTRAWLADIRGIPATTTTREYMQFSFGGGAALWTAIADETAKVKRIASTSDSERATIH